MAYFSTLKKKHIFKRELKKRNDRYLVLHKEQTYPCGRSRSLLDDSWGQTKDWCGGMGGEAGRGPQRDRWQLIIRRNLRGTELSSGGASCPRSKGAPRGWGIQAETGWFLVSGVIEEIQVSERGLEQMRNVSNLRRWESVSDSGKISVSRARWPSRCFCSDGETWRVRVLPAWKQEWPGMPRCFRLSILESPLVRGGALSVGS